jgi:hypothetical protein
MDNLQWNVNGFCTHIPELSVMWRRNAPEAVCLQETHLHPAHITSLRGYTSYWYNRMAGDRPNGATDIFVQNCTVLCGPTAKQCTSCCCSYTWQPSHLQSAVCVFSHSTSLLPWQISRTYSLTFLLIFYCCETSVRGTTFGGSVDEDKRGWAVEALIPRFILVVLNIGEPTHLSLLVTSFVLTLPCAVLPFQLTSCGSYFIFVGVTIFWFVCFCSQVSFMKSAVQTVVKQADWSLFSQLPTWQRTVWQSKHHSWGKFISSVSNSIASTVVWERLRQISSKCSRTFIPSLLVN